MPLVCLYGRLVVLMPVLGSQASLARVLSKGSHLVDLARACRVFLLQLALAASTSRVRPLVFAQDIGRTVSNNVRQTFYLLFQAGGDEGRFAWIELACACILA